ncbi:MAG: glycosyltransferase [Chloroflexi bacterium]|nr:glycosyltransferase [Chloroflexota bacterium]
MKRQRIGFVVPRYGEDVLGGAETLARCLAEAVVVADLADVEVLTTCARDHHTWENELTPGVSQVNGVPVRRFPVAHHLRDKTRYEALHWRLIQRELLPVSEQHEWIDQSAHSPQLYTHIEKCGRSFNFLFFVPYLFGTTYYGSAIHPERSVLWPCLHDEIYAYLQPTREMYHSCLGVMFNTYPEKRLAQRLYGAHDGGTIVGFGMADHTADAQRFRNAHNLYEPFVLYSGRLEGAKNVPMLIQHFLAYKEHNPSPLKLVLMGQGPERISAHRDIITIGFRQGQEKLDAYAAAMLLCQPSVNESFSIVIMESWLSNVPVLVHSDCEVTQYHAVRSNGGLYFRTYQEFEAILDLLLREEALRQQLAHNGRTYVRTEYSWDRVLKRFAGALDLWDGLRRRSSD